MYRRETINCNICGVQKTLAYRSINKAIKKHGRYLCQSCIMKQPEFSIKNKQRTMERFKSQKERDKISNSLKEHYKNPSAKLKVSKNSKSVWSSPEFKRKRSQQTKKQWENAECREKIIKGIKNSWTENRKIAQSNTTTNLWKKADYRIKREDGLRRSFTVDRRKQLSETSKKLWQSDSYRNKHASSMATISSSILDKIIINVAKGLGYDAMPISLGPWTFDALIKNDNGKDLLIECQGDYYHNRQERIIRDKQKRTYYNKHLSKQYNLLIIWEHEFYCIGKIIELLESKLELPIIPINYNLSDLQIKSVHSKEVKSFFDQYHYLRKYRSGPVNIVAMLDGIIVAAVVYGSPTRQNSASRLKLNHGELLELTRLCVHPKYRKKNLSSYLLSRSIKWIRSNCKTTKAIITFADTTLGHNGTTYKASNFEFDGEVKPTYWYVDSNGYYRHKKTVWDQSKRLGMTEHAYANYCKLMKVKGQKLLRFVYWLK